jgi:hypothetical protein
VKVYQTHDYYDEYKNAEWDWEWPEPAQP